MWAVVVSHHSLFPWLVLLCHELPSCCCYEQVYILLLTTTRMWEHENGAPRISFAADMASSLMQGPHRHSLRFVPLARYDTQPYKGESYGSCHQPHRRKHLVVCKRQINSSQQERRRRRKHVARSPHHAFRRWWPHPALLPGCSSAPWGHCSQRVKPSCAQK